MTAWMLSLLRYALLAAFGIFALILLRLIRKDLE